MRTAWNIGKILRGTLGLEDTPCAENAVLIARLSRDLSRPESFFYDTAKFHRLYPSRPPVALSWTHYSALIRLEDPKERRVLEKRALVDGLTAKELQMVTRTLSRPGLGCNYRLPAGRQGSLGGAGSLMVDRGCLYHYRATNAPEDGRVLIDIGFGIERSVRCDDKGSFHSGLIVRAERNGEDYTAKIASFDKSRLYTYAGSLIRVVDGDTLIARVDLGFRTWITQTFRLRGIDAPEMTCALGRKSKASVIERLASCSCIAIKSYKQEKYGRFLADVFYLERAGDDREQILREGTFLNQELLDEGLAELYDDNRP